MALFMDVHTMPGPVGMADVEQAHAPTWRRRGATASTTASSGSSEEEGKIFCLVEAPDADAAISVHKEAHGLVADAIYPVSEGS